MLEEGRKREVKGEIMVLFITFLCLLKKKDGFSNSTPMNLLSEVACIRG